MREAQVRPSTFSMIIELANPVFIVVAVCVPIGALIIAMNTEGYRYIDFVHILTGGLWTGIDLFMGFVLGPTLLSMEPRDRVAVFRRLMPKMAFLMPVIAAVTGTAGYELAQRLHMFTLTEPRIVAALVVVALLTIQGFGVLLPNEIRIFGELLSPAPNVDRISRLGMFNAKLSGLQGVFQLVIIFIMASLRF